VAYLPDYLRLTGLGYSGLLAWLFVGYCRLLAAYWPGLLWLSYLPDYLRLTGLAYSGLLAWLSVGYCRLLAAYWPGLVWLTCLIICRFLAWLIMAYWPGCLLVTAGFLPLIGLAYCGLLA